MAKFWGNTVTKSVILAVLPIIYSIIFPYALTADGKDVPKISLYWISGILFVVHMVSLIAYGIRESKQKKELESFSDSEIKKNRVELDGAKKLLRATNKIVYDNASMIYELVQGVKDHSDINDWHLIEAKGDEICRAVYEMVEKVAKRGNNFAVSIMLARKEDGKNGYTMSSRIAPDMSHQPRTYRSFISAAEAEGYYYKKIFDDKPTRPCILPNKKEIQKVFKDSAAVDYSQYIALPIACRGNKVIGVLQIVAYGNSIISAKKTDLQGLCDAYFSVCTTLMLLTDKYENIHQVMKEGTWTGLEN